MSDSSTFKYDVAISFLVEDLALAQTLYERLSEGLEIFFFPRNQEELAGTNGLETMREPFATQSRLNLVLYRDKWGNTSWTGVESAAIQESCLQNHFENVFFLMVDATSTPPRWLPRTHVRFNLNDFTLEQAVGAIKARVQERGGTYKPLTPLRKAELFEAEEAYRRDVARMGWDEGLQQIQASVEELFALVGKHCNEITAQGHSVFRFASDINPRHTHQTRAFSTEQDGMNLIWMHPFTNSLEKSALHWQFFEQRLLIGEELKTHRYWDQPKVATTTHYLPALSRLREYGWRLHNADAFVSSRSLAERLIIEFLDRANKHSERAATTR